PVRCAWCFCECVCVCVCVCVCEKAQLRNLYVLSWSALCIMWPICNMDALGCATLKLTESGTEIASHPPHTHSLHRHLCHHLLRAHEEIRSYPFKKAHRCV